MRVKESNDVYTGRSLSDHVHPAGMVLGIGAVGERCQLCQRRPSPRHPAPPRGRARCFPGAARNGKWRLTPTDTPDLRAQAEGPGMALAR